MGELDNDNTNYPEHTRRGGNIVPYFWCEDNGIDIRPTYHYKNGTHEWGITITIKGKSNTDPKVYEKKDVMEQIYKYSEYYFNKYCYDKEEIRRRARKISESSARWFGTEVVPLVF